MPTQYPYRRIEESWKDGHTVRILATTALSLLLAIGVVKVWPPASGGLSAAVTYALAGSDEVLPPEIVPTTQPRRPPPPPAPLPPIVVPDDEFVEEELDLDADFLPLDDYGLTAELPPVTGDVQSTAQRRADTSPEPVRVVAPEYTRAARRRGIRAEVVIVVIVNEHGKVERSTIVERFLLGESDGLREKVSELGYGLEEAAVSAAGRWLFRPASVDGMPVRSEHQISLKFGV